jgi:hypothetical protein
LKKARPKQAQKLRYKLNRLQELTDGGEP